VSATLGSIRSQQPELVGKAMHLGHPQVADACTAGPLPLSEPLVCLAAGPCQRHAKLQGVELVC
jgi:hypothetical protein